MTLSDLEKYRANCELLECIDRQLGKKKVLISTQGSAGPPAYQLVTKKRRRLYTRAWYCIAS